MSSEPSGDTVPAEGTGFERAGAELRNPQYFSPRPWTEAAEAPRGELDRVRVTMVVGFLLPISCWVALALWLTFRGAIPLIGVFMLMVAVPTVPLALWVARDARERRTA